MGEVEIADAHRVGIPQRHGGDLGRGARADTRKGLDRAIGAGHGQATVLLQPVRVKAGDLDRARPPPLDAQWA
jgi:hypothetical protein